MQQSKVHVIVLAAGKGSRLEELGADTPKWLLPLDDVTIAKHHLDAFRLAAETELESIASIRVVTGHASQAVEQFLWGEDRVAIEAIYNPEYATLNNWYSLLVGLRSLDLEQGAGVIVLNADFVAPVEWMAQFIVESVRGSADALVAVDLERPLSEEAMKVSVSREDSSQSKLRCIGKVGVDEPVGEYVGMLMARGPVLTQLLETLESYRGCEDLDDAWYEQAVGQTADHGARWGIWPTPDSAWVEIDDHDDYLAALELVAGFSPGSREPA